MGDDDDEDNDDEKAFNFKTRVSTFFDMNLKHDECTCKWVEMLRARIENYPLKFEKITENFWI